MVQRVSYRRKCTYNTRSNKFKMIKTPGGKLSTIHLSKKASVPKAMISTVERLGGIHRLRAGDSKRATKVSRTVNRAYGGALTGNQLKDRIIRAFILDELKVFKRIFKEKAEETKKATAKPKKSKKKTTKK